MDLEGYYSKEAQPTLRYGGQLAPDFQSALAKRYGADNPSACRFSHTIELPDGRTLPGDLDLRGSEKDAIGGVDVTGKRVLEVGPLSGWMTSHLARAAREVVALEVAPGSEDVLVPGGAFLPSSARRDMTDMMDRTRRSWWFVQRQFGQKASLVYGDLHAPPSDLDRFDASIFITVLLRLANPFLALQNAAAATKETIIVTEPLVPTSEPEASTTPVALFAPDAGPGSQHWWHHSPAAVIRMLALVGFGDIKLTIHTPPRLEPALPFFTVVGRRTM